MSRLINRLRDMGIVYCLLAVLFLLELVFWLVFNMTRLPYIVDYDGSVPLAQAMEIARQGTLLIDHWAYQTTLGFDSPVPLAGFLHLFIPNVFVSYGLANNIVVLVMLAVVNDLFRVAGIELKYRFIGFCLLMVPFSYGPGGLGWDPMLLTGPSFYSVKLLIVFLCADVFLRIHHGRILSIWTWLTAACALVLAFSSGLSSGIYVLIAGVFALALTEVVGALHRGRITRESLISGAFFVAAAAAFLAGDLIARSMGFNSKSNNMTLVATGALIDNVSSCIEGMLELMGAVSQGNPAVFSRAGISQVFAMILVVMVIGSLVAVLVRLVQKRQFDFLCIWAIIAFAINIFILCVTNTHYGMPVFEDRYHVFTIAPLLAAIPRIVQRGELPKRLDVVRVLVFAGCIMLVTVANGIGVSRSNNGYDAIAEMTSEAREAGADALVVYSDASKSFTSLLTEGRIARLCDSALPVIISQSWGASYAWGGDTRFVDDYPDSVSKYVVVTDSESYELCTASNKDEWVLLSEKETGEQFYLVTR